MAITVNLYTFAKKVNSTGRPSASPLAIDCILKEACSVIYPVIGISKGATWNPSAYNYAQISAFSRYYYVNDWSYAEGLWWASLSVDALATWRHEILSDSAYILRSSGDFNGNIIDTLFPATTTYQNKDYFWPETNTPWYRNLNSGFYSVGIINSDATSMGAVSYYAFTPQQFATFKAFLLSDVTWTGIIQTNPDLGENLYKSLFNPFQYISSVLWFPIDFPADHGTAITSIKIGWWEVPSMPCTRITNFRHYIDSTLYAYAHDAHTERGSYVNGSPYSRYKLIAPPFGEFELDASAFAAANFSGGVQPGQDTTPVSIHIEIDMFTGKSILNVQLYDYDYQNASTNLLLFESQLAIEVQLAQIYSQLTTGTALNTLEQTATTLIKGLTGAVSGGGAPNKSGRFTEQGILDAIAAGENHLMQTGSNGSLAQFNVVFKLISTHFDLVEANWPDAGQPLCEYRNLNDFITHYIITDNAHVTLPGTETEITLVNDALNQGVHLE